MTLIPWTLFTHTMTRSSDLKFESKDRIVAFISIATVTWDLDVVSDQSLGAIILKRTTTRRLFTDVDRSLAWTAGEQAYGHVIV